MRLIDADALQERLKKKKPDPAAPRYTKEFNDAVLRFKSMVHSAPTIKAEQKKGKWIKPTGMMPPEYVGVYKCSECDGIAMRDWKTHKQKLSNFCPVCGADMRGEQE